MSAIKDYYDKVQNGEIELGMPPESPKPETEIAEAVQEAVAEVTQQAQQPEPTPEATEKPETAAETTEEEPRKKTAKDYAAERAARKEEERQRELAEIKEKYAKLEGYFEAIKKPEQQQPEIPDRDLYPAEYADYRIKSETAELRQMLEAQKAEIEQSKQQAQYQSAVAHARALESEYKAKVPLYDGAKEFFINQLVNDYVTQQEDAGYSVTTKAARQQVENVIEAEVAKQLLQTGGRTNPYHEVIGLAMERGYTPQPVKATGAQPQKPKTDFNKLSEVQQRTATLSGASGTNFNPNMNLDNANAKDVLALRKSGKSTGEILEMLANSIVQ